jgi:hypothetical protein
VTQSHLEWHKKVIPFRASILDACAFLVALHSCCISHKNSNFRNKMRKYTCKLNCIPCKMVLKVVQANIGQHWKTGDLNIF